MYFRRNWRNLATKIFPPLGTNATEEIPPAKQAVTRSREAKIPLSVFIGVLSTWAVITTIALLWCHLYHKKIRAAKTGVEFWTRKEFSALMLPWEPWELKLDSSYGSLFALAPLTCWFTFMLSSITHCRCCCCCFSCFFAVFNQYCHFTFNLMSYGWLLRCTSRFWWKWGLIAGTSMHK